MGTSNFTAIYPHAISTNWKPVSQAKLAICCFNFTAWTLGPEMKMLFPVGLTYKVPSLFLGNGVRAS